jgi:hypothetical protein
MRDIIVLIPDRDCSTEGQLTLVIIAGIMTKPSQLEHWMREARSLTAFANYNRAQITWKRRLEERRLWAAINLAQRGQDLLASICQQH